MTDATFTAYPAIDVRDGHVVRLLQGDYDRETRYADDPFGVAMRYVTWDLGYGDQERYRQREAHVGLGIELDNQIVPKRYGWQLGVRLAFAPHDAIGDGCGGSKMCAIARVSGQPAPEVDRAIDKSVLVEWSFLIGH